MRRALRSFVLPSAGALLVAVLAHAQDAQSLGDVARQARLQKQQRDAQAQSKDAEGKDASTKDAQGKDVTKNALRSKPPKKVITNDEIPEHVGPTRAANTAQPQTYYPQPSYGNSQAAEQWKSQILQMKTYIASMQIEITNLEQSVHYSGGNCGSACVQWNERQRQKQDQVEVMKQQLEQQEKRLEQMQERARRQGFGSSVYDP